MALITVDANGENCIVVASGANAALNPGDLENAGEKIKSAALILMQLEIPVEAVEYVINTAAESKVKVVLNPAPACRLSDELLCKVYMVTPNETEAEMLTGIKVQDRGSAEKAARALASKGIEIVVITLGAQGALVLENNTCHLFPAPICQAIDTTAAGDVFSGALIVAISEGKSILEAVPFACQAAALSVCKMGAQSSAPYRDELNSAIKAGNNE